MTHRRPWLGSTCGAVLTETRPVPAGQGQRQDPQGRGHRPAPWPRRPSGADPATGGGVRTSNTWFGANDAHEEDQGLSGMLLNFVNGGERTRIDDVPIRQQQRPRAAQRGGSHRLGPWWKAGVWDADGEGFLAAFNGAEGITVMGLVQTGGTRPMAGDNANGLAAVPVGTLMVTAYVPSLSRSRRNGISWWPLAAARHGARRSRRRRRAGAAPAREWVDLAAMFDQML